MTSTIQNGEGERLAQARAIVKRHYPEMAANYTGRRVQIALDALAREPATADVEREQIARIVCDIVVQITCAENATDASIKTQVDQSWHHWTDTADRILALSRAAPTSEPAIAEVIQLDRVAAAALRTGFPTTQKAMIEGRADNHDHVQAFAKHRRAALAQSSTPPASKGVEAEIAQQLVDCLNERNESRFKVIAFVHRHEIIAALSSPTPSNDTLQGRGEVTDATMRAALQDIADAEAIPNDAVAFVWCRDVSRAALQKDTSHDG